jgi:hypothetical protein
LMPQKYRIPAVPHRIVDDPYERGRSLLNVSGRRDQQGLYA